MLQNLRETLILSSRCRELFLPLHGEESAPLRARHVSMAGLSIFRGEYKVLRPAPAYHVALFTTDGRGILRQQDTRVPLTSGSITILPAGVVHHYHASSEGWELLWFHLGRRRRWRPLERRGITVSPSGECQNLVHLAELYAGESRAGREGEARLLAEVLARRLESILGEEACGFSGVEERLRRALREVESDLARPWTAATLARMTHLSVQHLNRIAPDYWGVTPMRMIARLRMERASQLLRITTLTVGEIAALVGYSDAFAFSSAFRKHRGASPMDWRRQQESLIAED